MFTFVFSVLGKNTEGYREGRGTNLGLKIHILPLDPLGLLACRTHTVPRARTGLALADGETLLIIKSTVHGSYPISFLVEFSELLDVHCSET